MSSSCKQQHPPLEPDAEPPVKRTRSEPPAIGSLEPGGLLRVLLNPADCDLDFNVDDNGLQGHALHEQGFAYCWSGARANVGITGGKYCFGCKIISEQAVEMPDTPSAQQHLCRIGISRGDDAVGNLGETLHSFGFGGTGKYSNAGKFSDYGEKFGVGDTIVCSVDLESRPLATIGFSKNGKRLGIAAQFDATSCGLGVVNTPMKNVPWESAIFPHVLLKNVVVLLQFSIEDGLIPQEGYKPWNCAIEDGNVIIGPSFFSSEECEVLMMVGLPASGKTTWAEKWVKEHPEKRYVILGTNLALDLMKVPGLLRKQNYGERFERLMDRATGIFNTLLTRAAKTPRNYILDQTNVYKSARNRKLKAFENYRKIAVVIFPTPDELKIRGDRRFKEMGKDVPQDAVNEMLANYVLPNSKDMPGSNEVFDEVIFTELSRVQAQRQLDEMKQELKSPFNLNAKTNFSPYSRESSFQSFSSPVAMGKEATPAAGGCQLYSQPASFPRQDIPHSLQVNAAYTLSGSSVEPRWRSGETNISPPTNGPYGRYPDDGTFAFRNDSFDPHQSSRDSSPYIRNAFERTVSSIADASPSQLYRAPENSRRPSFESPNSMGRASYGYRSDPPLYRSPSVHTREPSFESPNSMGRASYGYRSDPPLYRSRSVHICDPSNAIQEPEDGYRRPNVESLNSVGRPTYGYPSDSPTYRSPSGHHHVPGVPQLEHDATRTPTYEWRSPHYGSPYASSAPRLPFGTPPPMNSRHGSWYP